MQLSAYCSGGNGVAQGVRGSYPAISDAGRDVVRASSHRKLEHTSEIENCLLVIG